MSNKGWIALHRSILDWEWCDDHNTFRLFIFMLLSANHKDKKWRGIEVKRGSFISGRIKLSEKTGLSERNIRTCLKRLETSSEVTIIKTPKGTVFTMNNYNLYQNMTSETSSEVTKERPASDQQVTTTKQCNNGKNDNNKQVIGSPILSPSKNFSTKDFEKSLLDLGVDKQHLEDWMQVRKTKRAVNTKTALDQFLKECEENDFSVARAVKICAKKSWSGFNYKWLENDNKPFNNNTPHPDSYEDGKLKLV